MRFLGSRLRASGLVYGVQGPRSQRFGILGPVLRFESRSAEHNSTLKPEHRVSQIPHPPNPTTIELSISAPAPEAGRFCARGSVAFGLGLCYGTAQGFGELSGKAGEGLVL